MRNLVISASRVEIDTETNHTFLVDVEMSIQEYETIISQFSIDDIINIIGARDLLEHMDGDDILSYANDVGLIDENKKM